MQINHAKFNAIVEAAKTKAADSPAWLRAIEKAAAGILDGSLIVTVLAHGALVTGKNGCHHANGACDCEASRRGHTQCYHRAAARLMHDYETAPAAVSTPARYCGDRDLQHLDTCAPHVPTVSLADDVAASSRQQLIAEITNIWPRVEPTVHMYDALLRKFGRSHLDMLPTETLRDIRLALAA